MIIIRFIIITVLFVIALTAVTIWAYKRRQKLVMAGAAGNIFDSMFYGLIFNASSEFYTSYQSNEELLDSLPLQHMSAFTENILKSIDYEQAKKQREDNFRFLHRELGKYNLLRISLPIGPFAYPFMVAEGGELRRYLQSKKIYVAKLWPNVQTGKEGEYAEKVLPIPCDQRYSTTEMKIIAETISNYLGGKAL